MKKPELLAPAGKYECLEAAINAGADAIYLAGKEFGARAAAENFSEDELLKGLDLAHIHGKKIYLTINTLVKERELDRVVSFIRPFYDRGLDGVIVQDLGVVSLLKANFPGLEIHASTQMTITSVFGTKFLKENGICRIVPARELSLEEITKIKNEVDVEIECFIHGAMCYCYSGQCLFSSYLGGRSGNRGRCAQPCRLNYTVTYGNKYISKDEVMFPISLKDMCTIDHLDKLIEAGIDSFKIEGRLKSPEYVAGVTSIYRKYIDMYFDEGRIKVNNKDRMNLANLYVRTELSDGYYFRHNGDEMITKLSPSYCNNDDELLGEIKEKYLRPVTKTKVVGIVTLVPGELASIILKLNDIFVAVEGEEVFLAQNRPLTEEDVMKQLSKTGESLFEFDKIEIQMENNCFMPIKSLNDLRRKAFNALMEEIFNGN